MSRAPLRDEASRAERSGRRLIAAISMIAVGLALLGYSAYQAVTSPLGEALVDAIDFLHWRNALGLLLTVAGALILSPFSAQTQSRLRRHRSRADPRLTGRKAVELEPFLGEDETIGEDTDHGQSL